MAIAQGGASGGATKTAAVNNYWKNYSKYNTPKTPKITTPKAPKTTFSTPAVTPKITTPKITTPKITAPKVATPAVKTYDKNTDYTNIMTAELSKANPDLAKIAAAAKAREAKIAGEGITGAQSTVDFLSSFGKTTTPTKATDISESAGLVYTNPYAKELQAAQKEIEELKSAQAAYYDPQTYVDQAKSQFDASKLSSIASIREAYEKAKAELSGQLPEIEQTAAKAYNENDAYYNTQALPALRAAMEQAGLYRGGDMLSGNIDLLTTRGNTAGAIGQDKNNQINAINQAIAQLNTEQPLKEAEISASSDASAIAAALEAANTGVQNQLSLADRTGSILGTDTLDKISQAYKQTTADKQSYIDTINRFSDNYQQEINNVQNDGDTTNDWQLAYLQSARQNKVQAQLEAKAAQVSAASTAEKARYANALELWKQYGTATAEIANILGVPVGSKTADFNIDSMNAATSRQNANTSAQNAANKSTSDGSMSASSYDSYIKSNFDAMTTSGKSGIANYLTKLYQSGVSKDIINALAVKYGIE